MEDSVRSLNSDHGNTSTINSTLAAMLGANFASGIEQLERCRAAGVLEPQP